jgi:hypothetical protein
MFKGEHKAALTNLIVKNPGPEDLASEQPMWDVRSAMWDQIQEYRD